MTTATGFPGDVCGALLVQQAGGVTRAFSFQNGVHTVDTLDVLDVDFLICAANQEILDELVKIVGIG